MKTHVVTLTLVVRAEDHTEAEGIGRAAAEHLLETFNDDESLCQDIGVALCPGVPGSRAALDALYRDFTNNYLTTDKWGEHLGLSPAEAMQLYLLVRSCHHNPHPEN